jgi:hypothetical protein
MSRGLKAMIALDEWIKVGNQGSGGFSIGVKENFWGVWGHFDSSRLPLPHFLPPSALVVVLEHLQELLNNFP